MRNRLLVVAVLTAAGAAMLIGAAPAGAATRCIEVTEAFGSDHSEAGSDFLVVERQIAYAGGPVALADGCEGSEPISVDDGIVVDVTRPGGSSSSFAHDFSNGCSGSITPAGPFDLASHFRRGQNTATFHFRDLCGAGGSGASDVFLIYEEDATGPTVRITKVKVKHANGSAKVKFKGTDDVTPASELRFQCKLDRKKWRKCTSPKTYKRLKPGRHKVAVRATDEAGNRGKTARKKFRVR